MSLKATVGAASLVIGATGATGPSGGPTGATGASGTPGGPVGATGATGPGGGGMTLNSSVTPAVGGGQAGATQLSEGITPVSTPASAADSLVLPAATAGSVCVLVPWGANGNNWAPAVFAAVYPLGATDTINGVTAASDFFDFQFGTSGMTTLQSAVWFVCVVDGAWMANATAD